MKRRFLLRKSSEHQNHYAPYDSIFTFLTKTGILLLMFFLSDAPSIVFFLSSRHPTFTLAIIRYHELSGLAI